MLIFVFVFMFSITPFYCESVNAEISYSKYIICANSATIFESSTVTSQKLAVVSHKNELLVEIEDGSAKIYSSGTYDFYKVHYNSKDGYILSDLVIPAQNLISSVPNFNAQTNKDCFVFDKADNQYAQTEILLKKDTRIFLYEGFDPKAEYSAIAFMSDNQVRYGYLKNDDVSPDGINPFLITAAVVIVALVGVIFALVFMRRKKINLKNKKFDIKS